MEELINFCNHLNLSIHIYDQFGKVIKTDNKCRLVDKIHAFVTQKKILRSKYASWATGYEDQYVTIHNFKSTDKSIINYMGSSFKFGNKSFRLVDELWRRDEAITWPKFKELYAAYKYIPYELQYNQSSHQNWKSERYEKFLYCKNIVYKVQ